MIAFYSRLFGVFFKGVLFGTAGTKNDMTREINHVAFGNLVEKNTKLGMSVITLIIHMVN